MNSKLTFIICNDVTLKLDKSSNNKNRIIKVNFSFIERMPILDMEGEIANICEEGIEEKCKYCNFLFIFRKYLSGLICRKVV